LAAKADTPTYNIELTPTATAAAGNMEITVVTADTLPAGQMIAYAAVCEDSIPGIFKREYNYVVQEMFDFPIALVYPDTLDTVITFTHSLPVDKMHAVFFIQNMDTKEIMHSATKKFEEVQ